jgi:hypothetical protein
MECFLQTVQVARRKIRAENAYTVRWSVSRKLFRCSGGRLRRKMHTQCDGVFPANCSGVREERLERKMHTQCDGVFPANCSSAREED